MNPALDEATSRQKLAALGFVLVRIILFAVAWGCLVGISRAFGPIPKPPKNDPTWFYLILSAIGGSFLTVKYLEDLIYAARYGFDLFRWFDIGLHRPMHRFIPTMLASFIGANILGVVSGDYWRILTILPWSLIWIAGCGGYSPVIGRAKAVRKAVRQ